MAFDPQLVDGLIERHGRGREAAIPLLQGIQAAYRYLPLEALAYVCEKTVMTPSQVYGVATFFSQFRLTPVGEHLIKVCQGTACHVSGAEGLTEALSEALAVRDGETSADGRYTLSSVACVGCCSLAPVIVFDDDTYGKMTRTKAVALVQADAALQTEEEA